MAIISKSLPKQFTPLFGAQSLFEAAVTSVDSEAFANPLVVTSHDHRFLAEKQLRDCGRSGAILLEPVGKNTAPAVFAAAHHAMTHIGDALLLVMPSDHHIPDQDAFRATVLAGRAAAEAGAIVTFGVNPDRPETGYGYIELCQQSVCSAFHVKKFREKPDLLTAQKMLDSGIMCGMPAFFFRASTMLEHANNLAPEMLAAVQAAVDGAREDNNFGILITRLGQRFRVGLSITPFWKKRTKLRA